MMSIRLGSRVYYKDSGPNDTGTIVDIVLDDYPFVVKWDKQHESKWETRLFPPPEMAETLGIEPTTIAVNPSDENIDQFQAHQLVLIEY